MAATPKKELALDANVIFDLAENRDAAHDFHEIFQARGYDFVLTPTAISELLFLRELGASRERSLAAKALQNLLAWNCRILNLSERDKDRAEVFRERLSQLQLIPDEEWNDGLLLAEAALAGIPLLVTSDKHLLNVDSDKLALALAEDSLPMVHPVHPKSLARALR